VKAFISSLFTEDTYNVWVIWGSRAYEKHGMLTETLKGAHSKSDHERFVHAYLRPSLGSVR